MIFMKKLVVLAMVAAMSLSMAACGNNTTTNNGKENTEQAAGSTQTETQELVEQTEIPSGTEMEMEEGEVEIVGGSAGTILEMDFQERMSENPEISAQELADALISNSIIPFQGATMPVEPGVLTGFDNEITGFKEGVMFSPMISTIPFVGYIFTLEEGADVEAFQVTLNENSNLAWNICTEAEEKTVAHSGNKVFFLMSKENLNE